MPNLALSELSWKELTQALADRNETAGFVLAARAETSQGELLLLAREVWWVPDTGYNSRSATRLDISSAGFVPALKRAAELGAVPLFFHTHPHGSSASSLLDDRLDEVLCGPARIRTGQSLYGSLILGGTLERPDISGRVFSPAGTEVISKFRVTGQRLQVIEPHAKLPDVDIFDRQMRAFGSDGQTVLGSLRVGVVGAGGTGSAVFELLVRLGVGSIVVIDDDAITSTNLTRIHESGKGQIGLPKVSVAAEAAQRIGIGTNVDAIAGRITNERYARALTGCDVVFGCTDDNRGRAVLSRLAYWYLMPVIDMAFLVDTDEGHVRGLFGRVTTIGPGQPCLFCRGRIDQAALGAEALEPAERARLAGEGYVPGLGEPDPSVGAFTSLTACYAVSELLDRLFGFGGPATPGELLIRLHDRVVSSTAGASRPGHYCEALENWGRGDTEPFLEQLWPHSDLV